MNGRKMGAKTETLRLESSQSVAIQSDDVIVRAFLVGPSPDPGAANAAPGSGEGQQPVWGLQLGVHAH